MTRALGLDLSLTSPGIVVLERTGWASEPEVVLAEKVAVPAASKMARWDRINVIGDHVATVIEQYRPSMVGIEGYGQVSHGGVQSFVKVVEVGSVVRLVLWGNGLDWLAVPPQSLKAFIAPGVKIPSGKRGKRKIMAEVAARHGFETDSDDICDAYVAARFTLAYHGSIATDEAQLGVLERFQNKTK